MNIPSTSSKSNSFKFNKPLNLVDLNQNSEDLKEADNELYECLICKEKFELNGTDKNYLAHLLIQHKLVISDVDQIGDFKKYIIYWKEKLRLLKIEDICFTINTNTAKTDKGEIESYFLLCDQLPEDRQLRERLNIFKLEKAIKQQELERNDQNYFRKCLFCASDIGNNRSNLLNHMSTEHNFNIGHADNIVYFDEFYQKLKERFDSFQCLYCDKIFYDKQILKEHMRKKQHKCINPQNREFDKFYMINYLEYSKLWQDIKLERDNDDLDFNENFKQEPSIEDWNDPVQDFVCLFCVKSYDNEHSIVKHMVDEHNFDFKSTITSNNLSFYNQVKLINFIRRQVFLNTCFVCKEVCTSNEELLFHLNQTKHINSFPDKELWDQPEYFFSTFEDDSLLCLLDDSGYSKDELKIQVIPEQFNLKLNDEIYKNLKDLSI